MWISVVDEPVPTYGMDGKTFLLNLCYQKYYGHDTLKDNEVVTAIWDSDNECFYESKTIKLSEFTTNGIQLRKRRKPHLCQNSEL